MRDFLTPFACGDGDGCSCGGTFEIVKNEPESDDNAEDPDCGDDCACHDTDNADCGDDCACHDETTDCGCGC
ncbi:MAG: hypothetical protein HN389_09000 [Clostridia bacterium]|jgi:hypothetical protein|nr:hypothetical protein [Clostridia bacterium]